MKMVILGAGASFDWTYEYYPQDVIDVDEWRPPLANQLFDTRGVFRGILEGYQGAFSFINEIRLAPDVEEFFQQKWNFAKKYNNAVLMAKLFNVQYYLQDLLYQISERNRNIGTSNYTALLSSIYEYTEAKNEEVLIVSFNYDLLAEYAFSDVYGNSLIFENIEEYISKKIKIIKPHGSCNWCSLLKGNNVEIMGSGPKTIDEFLLEDPESSLEIVEKLESQYVLNSPVRIGTNKSNNEEIPKNFFARNSANYDCPTFPRMLLPYKEKDDVILPPEHMSILTSLLPEISEVLVIGWKGTEFKFLETLKEYISNKIIKFTTVTARDFSIVTTLKDRLGHQHKYETFQHMVTPLNSSIVKTPSQFTPGGFSSYTISVNSSGYDNMFKF